VKLISRLASAKRWPLHSRLAPQPHALVRQRILQIACGYADQNDAGDGDEMRVRRLMPKSHFGGNARSVSSETGVHFPEIALAGGRY
jgi:hypothetical protein